MDNLELLEFNKKKQSKINEIIECTKVARKNRALLSYKYDSLKMRMNILQVTIIILSTMITFLEAIKSHYNFDETTYNMVTISMSTLTAFIMAIYRFFRIEENKENVKQSLESHVFIINKLLKIIHTMQNFYLADNMSEWQQIETTYDGEIFDNFIAIKEKFDALFSFQDSIYYKRKYKRDFLELEFTNKEIRMVDKYKDAQHEDFVLRLKGWLYYIFCCIKRERVDYSSFMRRAERGQLQTKNPEMGTQTNADDNSENKENVSIGIGSWTENSVAESQNDSVSLLSMGQDQRRIFTESSL